MKFLVGGLAPSPQSKRPQLGTHKFVHQQKAKTYSTITGNYVVLQERLRAKPGLAFSTTELMLTVSLSSLRQLLPKPLTNHLDSHSLAPPPTSLQNLHFFPRIGAIGNADFAAVSAGPFDAAQSVVGLARQADTADQALGPRFQENQNGRAEGSGHPIPKVPIKCIRKPEKRQARGSKTSIACEHCRWVFRIHCINDVQMY